MVRSALSLVLVGAALLTGCAQGNNLKMGELVKAEIANKIITNKQECLESQELLGQKDCIQITGFKFQASRNVAPTATRQVSPTTFSDVCIVRPRRDEFTIPILDAFLRGKTIREVKLYGDLEERDPRIGEGLALTLTLTNALITSVSHENESESVCFTANRYEWEREQENLKFDLPKQVVL